MQYKPISLSTLSAYMLQCEGHRKSWEEAFIILTLRSIFKYSKFKTLHLAVSLHMVLVLHGSTVV